MSPSEAVTNQLAERREARRFNLNLPLLVRLPGEAVAAERPAATRNVSFRGLYFILSAALNVGSSIEFVLMLPSQLTGAGGMRIRGVARIVRVEPLGRQTGVAVRIERYEFLAAAE